MDNNGTRIRESPRLQSKGRDRTTEFLVANAGGSTIRFQTSPLAGCIDVGWTTLSTSGGENCSWCPYWMLPKNCWRQGCCESLEMVGATEKAGTGHHSIQYWKSQTDSRECYFMARIIESICAGVSKMDFISGCKRQVSLMEEEKGAQRRIWYSVDTW
jgi:hypothetical protein